MKRKLATHLILLAALLATACHNPVNPDEGETTAPLLVEIDIECEAGATRGFIDADETAVNNLNLFLYDETAGLIHSSGYFTSYGALRFDHLIEGRRYRLLALANTGRKTAPARLAQALQMRVSMDDPGSISEGGIPMACDKPFTFGSAGDGYAVCLHLKRLMARYALRLDLSRMQGTLELSSAELHNVAGSVNPWAEESRALADEICDGDCLTEEELEAICEGEPIRLLVPENMQGNLLENNDDPWLKTAENLDESADCCTYLEITARYRFEGMTINNLCYRFYLGEDNIRNFDVRRNTSYVVTLSLTDTNAVVASSWKISRGDVEDSRVLLFNRHRDTLLQHASLVRSLLRQPTPFGYRLVAGEGFSDAGLSFTDDGAGGYQIRSGGISGHHKTGRLWAVSWDGAKRDSCDITVMNWDTLLTVHSTRHVMWPGDTARLTASMFFENNGTTRDVTRETRWSIGGSSAGWFVGSTVDQDTVKFYGSRNGALFISASCMGRSDSLRTAISIATSVGSLGPNPYVAHLGDTLRFNCYVRFASGDTLHCNDEFGWRLIDLPPVSITPDLPRLWIVPQEEGSGSIQFYLLREPGLTTTNAVTVLP